MGGGAAAGGVRGVPPHPHRPAAPVAAPAAGVREGLPSPTGRAVPLGGVSLGGNSAVAGAARELLAGGVAGAVSKTAVAPLERLKIMYQTGSAGRRPVGALLANIARQEGFTGWYRGNGASVLRVFPYAALHFWAYEHYRRLLVARRGPPGSGEGPFVRWALHSPGIDLLAGAAAGATAVFATYPLDLVRTRLAWQGSALAGSPTVAGAAVGAAAGETRSIRAALRVAAAPGVLGLYRGVGPTLAGILPYAGLKFYVYQGLKQVYGNSAAGGAPHVLGAAGDASAPPLPIYLKLLFGASAGLVAQTITYPIDVVRRVIQVQDLSRGGGESTALFSTRLEGTFHGLRTISREHGLRALFSGLSINYLKVVPATAIGFTVYDSLKSQMGHPSSL